MGCFVEAHIEDKQTRPGELIRSSTGHLPFRMQRIYSQGARASVNTGPVARHDLGVPSVFTASETVQADRGVSCAFDWGAVR